MNFIIDIENYLQTDCLKQTYYSDGKKCKSLENTTNGYSILRYDKSLIDMKNYDNAKNIGSMRSVIVSKDGVVVCCSPGKSIQWEEVTKKPNKARLSRVLSANQDWPGLKR